jgi:putative ABC transport system permease protein
MPCDRPLTTEGDLTKLLRSLLFEIEPSDMVIFALVRVVLVLVDLMASYAPGRRATRVDPIVGCRSKR